MADTFVPVPEDAENKLSPNTTLKGKLERLLLRRYPVWPIVDLIAQKKVPIHRSSLWYVMGGLVLFFLVVQFVSGILLMVYYRPSQPWQSILRIAEEIPYGEVVRSVHHWGANFMIAALFLHLFSTLLMKAYRPPRELTWITGLGLFALVMGFGFTGYLLPWEELSFYATKVGLSEAEKMPVLGPWVADLLRGGPEVSQDTIGRFFLIHVVLLPLGVLGLVGIHLLFIQLQGMSEPDHFRQRPIAEKRYKKFFTQYLPRETMLWLVFGAMIIALAIHYPKTLDNEANPLFPAPEGIKPEWFFLANYQLLKLFPGKWEAAGAFFMTMAPAGLFMLPFIDRSIPSDKLGHLVTAMALFGVVSFVGLAVWGHYS